MLADILILITGLIILIAGGEILVRGASSIALKVHISPIVVGLTVVAFGTSAPELLICIQSAASGSPDLAMGNVVGSNICNLGLVLGVTAIFYPIVVQKESIRIYWPMTMGCSVLLFLLIQDGLVHRFEGLIFIIILSIFITWLIRFSRKKMLTENKPPAEGIGEIPGRSDYPVMLSILLVALGSVGLYFGSSWFVNGAQHLAESLGVSERIIGITVLALGTSLPELATSTVAAIRKSTDMAVGNLLGSNIFNILSILGFTSIIQSITVNNRIMSYDLFWMLGITFLVFPIMLIQNKVSRPGGALLFSFYLYYSMTLFGLAEVNF